MPMQASGTFDWELLDVLAHLIDPPLFSSDNTVHPVEQQIETRFKQLPWTVETALLEWLHGAEPRLFSARPRERFERATYADANDDLTNAGIYYSGRSYLIDYQVSPAYVSRANIARGHNDSAFVPDSVERWMKEAGLYEASIDNLDPHFAERAFVTNILIPAYGIHVLARLKADDQLPG